MVVQTQLLTITLLIQMMVHVFTQVVQIQQLTNYDANANLDDGSCVYASVLNVTTTVCTSASSVRMTGPWWNWDPNGGPVAVDNGNGTWTFTFNPTNDS